MHIGQTVVNYIFYNRYVNLNANQVHKVGSWDVKCNFVLLQLFVSRAHLFEKLKKVTFYASTVY